MLYVKKFWYFSFSLIMVLTLFHFIVSGLAGADQGIQAATGNAGAEKSQAATNSLSKFSISHSQDNANLNIHISGPEAEDLSVAVDESVMTLREKGKPGIPGYIQSFSLPAAVDSEGAKVEKSPGKMTITLPLTKKDDKNPQMQKSSGGRKWYFEDKDMQNLFNFNMPAFGDERDVNIRKFFEEDEMFPFDKYFDEIMKVRSKMHRELKGIHKAMPKGMNSFSEYNVTHNIEGGNMVVKITGSDLTNVTVKVENNVMMIENRNEKNNTKKDENSYSSQQFYSSFAQSFTIPVGVDSTKMKVDRKSPGEIVVTIPVIGGGKGTPDQQGLLKQPEPAPAPQSAPQKPAEVKPGVTAETKGSN